MDYRQCEQSVDVCIKKARKWTREIDLTETHVREQIETARVAALCSALLAIAQAIGDAAS